MTPTFYVLHGTDDLRLSEEVERLRAQMGDSPNAEMNISEFDGEIASVPEIMNAAMSFPFLADKRLVIARGLLSWITRKGAGESGKRGVEQLVRELPQLPDWSRVVFVERGKLASNHKILKLAQQDKSGYEKAFNAPKDFDHLDHPARERGSRGGDRSQGGPCAGLGDRRGSAPGG